MKGKERREGCEGMSAGEEKDEGVSEKSLGKPETYFFHV